MWVIGSVPAELSLNRQWLQPARDVSPASNPGAGGINADIPYNLGAFANALQASGVAPDVAVPAADALETALALARAP